jgi:hypothetical protein
VLRMGFLVVWCDAKRRHSVLADGLEPNLETELDNGNRRSAWIFKSRGLVVWYHSPPSFLVPPGMTTKADSVYTRR